jgi:K(+)-stimulated pyrophosphate-energized sodium pump
MGNYTLFEQIALWSVLGCSFLGILYGFILMFQILKKDQGTDKMKEIAKDIQDGASAYLKRQFKTIIFITVILGILLYFTGSGIYMQLGRSISFLVGAFFSGLIGFIGMMIAVRGNVRTAAAARTSFHEALEIAFRTGSITGMFTIGLGLLGCTAIFLLYGEKAYEVLVGFGFGGSLLALFMRVGGGIYTKAADVGADLVGKVEAGIPEDDPRNAAVIADNVGDNVGDCAGMAADIFESYEVTLVASMILGWSVLGKVGVIFPLIVRAVGVITSILGTYLVRARKGEKHAMAPINRGFFTATLLSGVGFFGFAYYYVGKSELVMERGLDPSTVGWQVFWATVVGLVLAIGISKLTEYFTSEKQKPVHEIADSSITGHATNILSGIATGLESSVWAIISIVIAIFVSILIAGGDPKMALYLISLAGMGMLTTTGLIVSMDSYGPVADNANGIAEMVGMEGEGRRILHLLDAVGNTTKATTKGFAITTAVIAATSLFGSYFSETGLDFINVANPMVLIGLLIGGAVPFLFTSLSIRAVARTAGKVIQEVRRQFNEIKGLMAGETKPDYAKTVDICTRDSLRELVGPGIIAVASPILIGFLFHAEALGGFLAGIILTGQLLAVFLANAGGAWDNAKKLIEDGYLGGKGSDEHKVSVVGDTVGDPFKDTAGPALNPLIKVMNLVALLIAPMIVSHERLNWFSITLVVISLLLISWAIWKSKREAPFQIED